MAKKNDGGAAFPQALKFGKEEAGTLSGGMSMRDYFAGQAMVGLVANTDLLKVIAEVTSERVKSGPDLIAEFSYKYADAMLEERNK